MSTDKRITPQELPKLIAAAVEKALAQHPVTQEQLANLGKFPIRCGIFPYELNIGFGAHEAEGSATEHAATPVAGASPVLGHRPLPFGFVLREFNLLVDPGRIQAFTDAEKEK